MPKLKRGKECCGCTACASICPKDAIKMSGDNLGFVYPEVDLEKCVECGACERVCAFNDDYNTPENYEDPIPFGVRLKDLEEVMKSRSGGAFVAFSDWVLARGGSIYGVGFKDHFVVAHKRAVSAAARDEFRGSKYVQSNLDGIFPDVKTDLKNGKWVLFSGTGCQVAGLKAYLPELLQEKLITVDIVCHGVPSPKIWKDYLEYVERREKKIVTRVNFRNKKDFGWKSHKETFTLIDPVTTKITTITYPYRFYQHVMQRPSCGVCHFCNTRRPADLTLADFWGWEKTDEDINSDNKGLSLVFVNTPKGMKVFEDVRAMFYTINPKLEDCMQTHLKEPTLPNPHDNQFKADYEKYGFEYVMKKYGNLGWRYKLKKYSTRIYNKLKKY